MLLVGERLAQSEGALSAAARLGFRARTTFTDGVTAFATDPLRSPITTNR